MVTTSTSFLAFSFLFSGLFRTQTVIYKKMQFISCSTLYLLTLPYNFVFFSQTTKHNELFGNIMVPSTRGRYNTYSREY